MTVSKRTYAFLTLPWRCLDGWANSRWRPTQEGFHFVTTCKVVGHTLIYPLAWPFIVVLLAAVAATFVFLVPLTFLAGLLVWVASKIPRPECRRVIWKEDGE